MSSTLKILVLALWFLEGAGAFGADGPLTSQPQGPAASQPSGQPQQGERLDVDRIRRNYWNRGDDNDARVVQNRIYSKTHRLEFGMFAASISGDPFLQSQSIGMLAGYHFSESVALMGIYWKTFTTGSSALDFLQQQEKITANTNFPHDYKGGEFQWSPIYGKLSVLGEVIIHYDLHVLGGLGMTGNENGNQFTISGGIGQQVYLNKSLAVRLDYRLMRFDEGVIQKNTNQADFGQVILSRTNYSGVISLGVDVLFP
jgi:outer membrane beta-barrel protein